MCDSRHEQARTLNGCRFAHNRYLFFRCATQLRFCAWCATYRYYVWLVPRFYPDASLSCRHASMTVTPHIEEGRCCPIMALSVRLLGAQPFLRCNNTCTLKKAPATHLLSLFPRPPHKVSAPPARARGEGRGGGGGSWLLPLRERTQPRSESFQVRPVKFFCLAVQSVEFTAHMRGADHCYHSETVLAAAMHTRAQQASVLKQAGHHAE